MAEMSMNMAIHGAFRRDLTRFITALSNFPTGDLKRGNQFAAAWFNFDDQLTQHHTGEHEMAWPALVFVGAPALDMPGQGVQALARTPTHADRAQPGQCSTSSTRPPWSVRSRQRPPSAARESSEPVPS